MSGPLEQPAPENSQSALQPSLSKQITDGLFSHDFLKAWHLRERRNRRCSSFRVTFTKKSRRIIIWFQPGQNYWRMSCGHHLEVPRSPCLKQLHEQPPTTCMNPVFHLFHREK